MYRCQICDDVSRPGASQLRHPVLRPGGSIAREVAVCGRCAAALAAGTPLDDLAARHRKERPVAATVPLPVQPTPPVKPAGNPGIAPLPVRRVAM